MATMHVLNQDPITWYLNDPDSIKAVQEQFDSIIAEGYMAFRVDSPETGELIRDFDPTAQEIIISAPMVGG